MVRTRYHHVSLRVRFADVSARFYGQLFAYREILRHELPGAGQIIHLAQDDDGPVLELIQDNEAPEPTKSSFHLGFSCHHIREFLETISELGLKIERGPLMVGQETLFFFRDPDGYLIEVNDGL